MKRFSTCVAVCLATASLLFCSPSASANVFASDIRINGRFIDASAAPGDTVEISYILNEPASAGVVVEILNGSTVVRSLAFATGSQGALRGTNSITWDLLDSHSNTVAAASYTVRVIASANGYSVWTQITSDDDASTYVYDGRGIASLQDVSNNYFGRLFLANSAPGFPESVPGNVLGILKWNADGSAPEDGATSTGGRNWPGNELGPWKTETSGAFVYANDLSVNGQVFRWDPTVSSNSLQAITRADNRPAGASFGGFAVVGPTTNSQLWAADRSSTLGVRKWNLLPDGTCAPGDTGVTVVGLGTETNSLTLPPQDVALDPSGNVYVCQSIGEQGNPLQRVFRFAAYDPSTNGGAPQLTPQWAVGANDDSYGGASGIAVDPTGTYVAAAFQGVTIFGLASGGNTKILYATNGGLVTNLDLGLIILGDSNHQDTDCAWDAAGNVYYIDNWWGRWRAVSPPGPNQFSTVARAAISVAGNAAPPAVTGIAVSNSFVRITFTGSAADVPGNFIVLGSSSVSGPFVEQNATITPSGSGVFVATLPLTGNAQFFQVSRRGSPAQEPSIQSIQVSGGVVTILFSGSPSDTATSFTLLSTVTLDSAFTAVSGAQFTGSSGSFRVTAPVQGPMRFYRLQR